MSSYSLSLQELSDLSGEALATVMGPADDTALCDLLQDKATRLVTAYQTYQDSIRFILEMVKRISKADNKIAKMHKQIAEAIDSSDEEGSDEEQMPSDKESDEFKTDTEKQAYRSNQAEIDKKNKAKRRLAQKKTGQTNIFFF